MQQYRGHRRSLIGLVVAAAALSSLWAAAPAWSHECLIAHVDTVQGYVGPAPEGIACRNPDGSVGDRVETWIVPGDVTRAKFIMVGGGDPIGGLGGNVEATLALVPGETLTLTLGGIGRASSVSRPGVGLLVAGGGNGLEPNYTAPGATAVWTKSPGQPSAHPQTGSIYVSWRAGWIDRRPDCVVPKLRGQRPVAARRTLIDAGCAAGAVGRRPAVKALRGKVVKQSPPAGTTLAPDDPVRFWVGRHP